MALLLAACEPTEEGTQPESKELLMQTGTQENDQTSPLSGEKKQVAATRAMQQPKLADMENLDALKKDFSRSWEKQYTFSECKSEEMAYPCDDERKDNKAYKDAMLKYCYTDHGNGTVGGITLYTNANTDDESYQQNAYKVSKEDFLNGKPITVTGFQFQKKPFTFSDEVWKQLEKRGWTITDLDIQWPTYEYEGQISTSPFCEGESCYRDVPYDEPSATHLAYSREERLEDSMIIGGSKKEYERFPFNTLLVTDDLLLHSYHKLFDNALKGYEKKTARPMMNQLSKTLFEKYDALAKKEEKSELKDYYEFLSAYWAVPYTLLPTDQELEQYGAKFQDYQDIIAFENGDSKMVKEMVTQRANTIKSSLPQSYQKAYITTIENIFKEEKAMDALFYQLDAKFFDDNDIIQDYSQYTPRSHYTDDIYLATYFRAMKWFMREKFYFGSEKSTKALLTLGASLEKKELTQLESLANQIANLIGQDDDLTTFELMDWIQKKEITSQNVLSKYSSDLVKELSNLHPQKIISTSYGADDQQALSEEAAHAMTDGFVFFGEKFTVDSYVFDLMTAGSAEEEFVKKPNKQTALMIPDILENNGLAGKMVDLRFNGLKATNEEETLKVKEDSKIWAILEGTIDGTKYTQISSYPSLKKEAQKLVEEILEDGSFTANIYHHWLQLLGQLLLEPKENAPYFMKDPLYAVKNLITYMGSYTELKHDTLLYVKQAYAEMGGGAPDICDIHVKPTALPVPKGYVESQATFIDALIELSQETAENFDEYEKEKMQAFINALTKIKAIALAQEENKKISDEEFEYLRTEFLDTLADITREEGEISVKKTRGAVIADIFNSEEGGPLYEALGRPALLIIAISDINGSRLVMGPVYTHYELYGNEDLVQSDNGRYTDQDWQTYVDTIKRKDYKSDKNVGYSVVQKYFLDELKK